MSNKTSNLIDLQSHPLFIKKRQHLTMPLGHVADVIDMLHFFIDLSNDVKNKRIKKRKDELIRKLHRDGFKCF